MPGNHRAGQVGIDHQRAQRVSCQRAGQCQHQRRPSLGPMATGEEQYLDALPLVRIEQKLRHLFKAFAPFSFESQHERGPLQLDR